MTKQYVSPRAVKELRRQKDWSQDELAKRASVTTRQISNIETSQEDALGVHKKTFNGLRKALGVSEEVLSGQKPVTPQGKRSELRLTINPSTRLNFDLLKKRYGVEIEDIVEVAALLFMVSAEESLQKQQRELQKQIDNPSEVPELFPGLHETEPHDIEEHLAMRKRQIRKNDVFCEVPYDPFFWSHNPFADYLYTLSQRPDLQHLVELIDERSWMLKIFNQRIPSYRICPDTLKEITLGSTHAERALDYGVTSISEIPEELWEPRQAGNRVEWLEDRWNSFIKENYDGNELNFFLGEQELTE